MKTALLVLGLSIAAAYSSVVPIKGERKLADATFLTRQKHILDLYIGLPHYLHYEKPIIDIATFSDKYEDSSYLKNFLDSYKRGFLPKDGVFTMSCHHTRMQTIRLFDIFFFAKDFDSFYEVAFWARNHIHPVQFAYAYTLALIHRPDCQQFSLPPLYEVFPNYFTPQETLHKLYDDRMLGIEEKKYEYNNTGYEYNYHSGMFGGPLSGDAYEPHLDYKISYFREDVGANAFYSMWRLRFPSWMCPLKYKKSHWFKVGESFYYTHQQIFARYSLERLANGLPYVEPLYWERPIKTGYNPRIAYANGVPFYTRPDNFQPKHFNKFPVHKAQAYEERIYEVIDAESFWEITNSTLVNIRNDDGIDYLGKMVYGTVDRPSKNYFGSFFHASMDALGYLVKTSNDHDYVGGALTTPMTTLRDPVFYNYLNRLTRLFQWHKKNFHPYTNKELAFPGVKVKDIEFDKLVTYFDHFDYEISNALPAEKINGYTNLKFFATQYRLNHKPFTYKVTVDSDNAFDGIVRVFIGPKYDSEENKLTLEQKRLLFVEFDRFPVKLTAGQNVFERNSKESPVFVGDFEGFRHIYNRVENAIKNQEPFYINEKYTCGVPERFQLPRGWKSGQPFTISVVVSQFEKKYTEEAKDFYATCGSSKLYDYRPLGYPFDKPVHEFEFDVSNIYFKDVLVYHKDELDINRAEHN